MALASGVGLASGIPTNDIISQLLSLRAQPIRTLQGRIQDFQNKQGAIVQINNALLELRNAAERLSDPASFAQRSFNTSSEAVGVAGDTTATPGGFSVDVLQLASASRLGAQGFADANSTAIAAAPGTFSFRLGNGAVESIDVDASTTLSDLRDAINALGADVRASVINDGSETNPFRLVLTSERTGAANAIEIVQNDTALDFTNTVIEDAVADSDNTFAGTVTSSGTFTGTESQRFVVEVTSAGATGAAQFRVSTDGGVTFGPANEFTTSETPVAIGNGVEIAFSADTFAVGDRFTIDAFQPEIQTARDAVLRVDGVTITRDSNTVADAVEGVTLTLNQVTSSSVNVSVGTDTDAIRGRINTFVAQYNAVIAAIEQQTVFDAETNIRGPLLGDSAVRSVQSTLALTVSSQIPGIGTGEINSLAGIGIRLGEGGRLVVNAGTLDEALANNLDTVQKLFATVGTPNSSSIEFVSATGATESGTYAVNITQAAEQAAVLGNQAVVGTLASAEKLTFTVNGQDTSVTIAAGRTLDQAVDDLNAFFGAEGFSLSASNEGGVLALRTTAFGSAAEIEVVSDQSGASASQLGIGTTARTDTGADVAGTIGGLAASGSGQALTAASGGATAGLIINVTGTGTGIVGSIAVSTGVGVQFENALESLTAPETGILTSRSEGFGETIEDLNERIDRIRDSIEREESRLRQQFTALETIIAEFNSTSQFLSQQLTSLTLLTAGQGQR